MNQILTYQGLWISKERIAEFCRRWKVKEFAFFGSILRSDFGPGRDVDVLVSFAPGANWRFDNYMTMKEELEAMFDHSVDLVERHLVEQSTNYIRRKHILSNAETVYVG